jgi:hypothetical protein
MPQQSTPNESLVGGVDRRRVPRYSCSGLVQIASLPLNGIVLNGTVRDLGLGGCYIENIETTSRFDLGARTEILVKVNSLYFRAMAHVKALRERSGISVEFVRVSAGGRGMLAELIADLQRPRIGVIRHKREAHPPRRLSWSSDLAPERKRSPAIVGTIVTAESTEDALAKSRQDWDRYLYPEATTVDVFV